MKIKKLELENFRCFKEYKLAFSDRFTLLIGDNGSGKTAILDALALAVSEFLIGFSRVQKPFALPSISIDDVRYETLSMGQSLIKETPYMALLSVTGNINNVPISWSFSKKTSGQIELTDTVASIRNIAFRYAQGITEANTFLPVISYYGTGRLWNEAKKYYNSPFYLYNSRRIRKEAPENIGISRPNSRLLGYRDCLNSAKRLQQLFGWFKTQELAALQKQELRYVLEAVREAIVSMIPGAQNVWWDVDWDEILIETTIQGKSQTIPFHLLSDGYRNMIGMVADIAYRMATLNPQLKANVIKQTEGIVLIDEIDLHLHPKWQKQVVGRLLDTFPKIQFVASSHSPFIIQSLYHREDCLLWDLEKNAPVEVDSKSIEDIAENQQGVEIPQQSQRFLAMEKAAEEYYTVLKQIPPAGEDEKQRLRQRLDELLLPYSDDPAFQAFLKMERQAVEGSAEE